MLRILWEANPVEATMIVAITVVASVGFAICLVALVASYLD